MQHIIFSHLPVEQLELYVELLCLDLEIYQDYLRQVSKIIPSSQRLEVVTRLHRNIYVRHFEREEMTHVVFLQMFLVDLKVSMKNNTIL